MQYAPPLRWHLDSQTRVWAQRNPHYCVTKLATQTLHLYFCTHIVLRSTYPELVQVAADSYIQVARRVVHETLPGTNGGQRVMLSETAVMGSQARCP